MTVLVNSLAVVGGFFFICFWSFCGFYRVGTQRFYDLIETEIELRSFFFTALLADLISRFKEGNEGGDCMS